MERVGVRELRQNLSVYLRRVKAGESLEVTEHGHAVAVLGPHPAPRSAAAQLAAEGRLRPAPRPFTELVLPPGETSSRGSDALAADREGKE